jgi:U3 small nucleolar RNA-associated protein 25
MLGADGSGAGTLVFVPSYFDYVRLRNKLRASDVEAAELCEYTEPKEASRARSLFAHGELKALLYTERAHFFHRHNLRGVRHVCFYGLPSNAHLFAEVANLLGAQAGGAGGAQTMLVLFSAFDKLQLERAIGAERAQRVLQGEQRTFVMH